MQYFEHITSQNERWDTIAYAWYGDAQLMNVLCVANPHVPIVTVLPAGTLIFVPVLNLDARSDDSKLPPWRRRKGALAQ